MPQCNDFLKKKFLSDLSCVYIAIVRLNEEKTIELPLLIFIENNIDDKGEGKAN
jgi:hypothetical protein